MLSSHILHVSRGFRSRSARACERAPRWARPAGHLLRCQTSANRNYRDSGSTKHGSKSSRTVPLAGETSSDLRELPSSADQLCRLSRANTWLRFPKRNYPQKLRLLAGRRHAASSPTVIAHSSCPWTCCAVSRKSLPAGSRQDSAWAELFPPRAQARVKGARLETFNRREPQRRRAEPAPRKAAWTTSSPPWSPWKSPPGDVRRRRQ